MRKLLSFIFICFALIASARQITSHEAAIIASEFFNSSTNMQKANTRVNVRRALPHVVSHISEENQLYYVFNADDNKGFVIIAGDDKIPLILGYSFANTFDLEKFNKAFPNYGHNLEDAIKSDDISKLHKKSKHTLGSVKPMITTTWGQHEPYNDLTPLLEGNIHCVTGCTNTAQAQIMNYWKYPATGKGVVSYEWNGHTLSVDLSLSIYQWDKMLDNYDHPSYTHEENKNAVAILMRDCGYANKTSYSASSGAAMHYSALVNNFGYDKSIRIIERKLCSRIEFEEEMYAELEAGRPFAVTGTIPNTEGHAFICDGYDENGYFHFNFGWGGVNDGYYTITSGWNIDLLQLGIQPDCGGKPTITFGSESDFYYDDNQIKFDPVINSALEMYNDSYDEKVYYEAATICENTASHEIFTFVNNEFGFTNTMPCPYNLPDGEYVIYPAIRFEDGEWHKFTFYDDRQREINLYVTNGIYKYLNEGIVDKLDSGKVEIDGIYYILNDDATATVSYKNDKYKSYKSTVRIPDTITYEGEQYSVAELGKAAFRECKLEELTIGRNINKISAAFFISSIQNLIFAQPSQLIQIEGWGFNGCNVSTVKLPEGLKSIEKYAFQSCEMNEIYIPSSVNSLGRCVFNWCSNLEHVYVDWTSEAELPDVYPYDHLFSGCEIEKITLHVPSGTKSIYSKALYWQDLNIVEDNNSGIYSIQTKDFAQKVNIYNIQGICIKRNATEADIDNLSPGLYIIGDNKIKIMKR